MGFISPFTIREKILLQEMWISGLDWDEEVSKELLVKIASWFSELPLLSQIKVPRSLQLQKIVQSVSLHTFVDASQDAYGARIVYQDESVSVQLITTKTKVAPLQTVSIPHLELMGVNLGNKLAQSVSNVCNIQKEQMNFWTDSMNVLWWIRGRSKDFKPFVSNRVGEIHMSTCQ